jgi:ketosteroid isomerase-like protein
VSTTQTLDGHARSPAKAHARSAEEWVEGFARGWRAPGGREAFASHFREMLAEDVRLIQPQLPAIVGRRAFEEEFVRPLFALMPDVCGEVERWAARGDELFIEMTLHGTLGGRRLSWRVCDRVTLRDGVAVERESYFDSLPLLVAVVRTPRSWPRYLRVQARRVIPQIVKGRKK